MTGSALTPEADDLIARGRDILAGVAEVAEATKLYALAARETYTAVLNAAHAIIRVRTGLVIKNHSGTHSEISRLAHEDSRIDSTMVGFLAHGFELRSRFDYGGKPPPKYSQADALATVAEARRLIDHAAAYLAICDLSPPQ